MHKTWIGASAVTLLLLTHSQNQLVADDAASVPVVQSQLIDVDVDAVDKHKRNNQAPPVAKSVEANTTLIESWQSSSSSGLISLQVGPIETPIKESPTAHAEIAKPMSALTASTKNTAQFKPESRATSSEIGMPEQAFASPREFHWKAADLVHRPLYFQDVSLERYGHHNYLQPAVSAVKFGWSTLTLPYKMSVDRPCECESSAGLKRPGNATCPVCERLSLPKMKMLR